MGRGGSAGLLCFTWRRGALVGGGAGEFGLGCSEQLDEVVLACAVRALELEGVAEAPKAISGAGSTPILAQRSTVPGVSRCNT